MPLKSSVNDTENHESNSAIVDQLANPMKPTQTDQPVATEPPHADKRRGDRALRTSWFDAVSSFLTALILFLGTLVSVLVVVWMLSDRQPMLGPPPPPTANWGTDKSAGLQRDFLVPGAEEIVELDQPKMPESLLAVTDAVRHVAGAIPASPANLPGMPGDHEAQDGRLAGPDRGDEVVARFERWQLDFRANDVDSYARQLDHFKIELGAIGGGIQGLDYAGNLSETPKLRRGDSGVEKRLYFMWGRPSPLMRFDRQLLQRAGVQVEGREMLKFIPAELENQLAKMELEYAMARGQRSLNSIAKTVFTGKSAGDRFQFVVSEQRYRKQNH